MQVSGRGCHTRLAVCVAGKAGGGLGWAGLEGYRLGGQGRKGQGEGWRLKWWTGREEEGDVMREPMRRETGGG